MDIVLNALKFFPGATGEEFLALLKAAFESGPNTPRPTPLERFIATHPAAATAGRTAQTPSSFAHQVFNGVNAFVFVGCNDLPPDGSGYREGADCPSAQIGNSAWPRGDGGDSEGMKMKAGIRRSDFFRAGLSERSRHWASCPSRRSSMLTKSYYGPCLSLTGPMLRGTRCRYFRTSSRTHHLRLLCELCRISSTDAFGFVWSKGKAEGQ